MCKGGALRRPLHKQEVGIPYCCGQMCPDLSVAATFVLHHALTLLPLSEHISYAGQICFLSMSDKGITQV